MFQLSRPIAVVSLQTKIDIKIHLTFGKYILFLEYPKLSTQYPLGRMNKNP